MREWRARLLAQRLAEEIRLSRLSPADTARMTTLLIETGLPVARDVAAAVHARTDGIPLHVEELLAASPRRASTAPARSREADVPETVEDAIIARLEPRSPAARPWPGPAPSSAARSASTCVAGVVGVPPDKLSEPLAELADHFVLLPTADAGPLRLSPRADLRRDLRADRRARAAAAPRPDGRGGGRHRRRHGRVPVPALRTGRPSTGGVRSGACEARRTRARSRRTPRRGSSTPARSGPPRPTTPRATAPTLLEGLAVSARRDRRQRRRRSRRSARPAPATSRPATALAAAAVVGPHVGVRYLLGDGLETRRTRFARRSRDHGAALAPPAPSDRRAPDRVRGPAARRACRGLHARSAAGGGDRLRDGGRRLAVLPATRRRSATRRSTLGVCLVFAGDTDEGWALIEEAIADTEADHLEAEAARGYRMIGTSASVLLDYPRAERWLREGSSTPSGSSSGTSATTWPPISPTSCGRPASGRSASEVARQALADGRGGITTRIMRAARARVLALGHGELAEARAALDEARDLGRQMGELQRSRRRSGVLRRSLSRRGIRRGRGRSRGGGFAASAAVQDAAYLFPVAVTGTRGAARRRATSGRPPLAGTGRGAADRAADPGDARGPRTCPRAARAWRTAQPARRARRSRSPSPAGRPRPRLGGDLGAASTWPRQSPLQPVGRGRPQAAPRRPRPRPVSGAPALIAALPRWVAWRGTDSRPSPGRR